ncbi:MAG: tetratricopeptide repeat protein [Proteobacteria bacterium]|nr:tetratricopeptide repeat protein [Pseudomonadota bacterium]
MLGRYEEALSDFNKALELYPRNSIALMNIGGICEERGQDKEAAEYYTSAIQITPLYIIPYSKRAYLFAKEKNYIAAIEDYEKALSIDLSQIPKDACVDYTLSKTELDRIYPPIFHDCGISYLKIGNYLKGKEYLQRFLKIASPYHLDKIGQVTQVLAWIDIQLGIC